MLFAVALGGALGSVCRYLAVTLGAPRAGGFPWATFAVNVTGSFLLGFLARYFGAPAVVLTPGTSPAHAPALAAGLTAGFCGGYTTFSAFSYEMLTMAERGAWGRAMLYAAGSVTLALAAAAAGAVLARAARGGA